MPDESLDLRHSEEYRQLKIKHAHEGSTWAAGDLFEQYVADNIFPDEHFSIVDYTPRREDIRGRKIETVTFSPDFIFRDRATDEYFFIECKYRNRLDKGRLNFCTKDKLEKYRALKNRRNMKLFFIVGLGGEPYDPDDAFCFDIDRLEWGNPYISNCARHSTLGGYFESLEQLINIRGLDE
ncbi:MAG: hypothetical protein FWD92_06240 [Methanomassiliicoccaceae archaeon]|nr:hypothetical protein [Methanomassiliicoccaceae archaeon]